MPLGALGLLTAWLVVASVLAVVNPVTFTASESWIFGARCDLARSSVLAMQGAAIHARGPEQTFLFVGPSALAHWLPDQAESDRVAWEASGRPNRVLVMSGPALSYAVAAALIERFGVDFDGWIVIAVDRQSIGREIGEEGRSRRAGQSLWVGFDSTVLRAETSFLGYPQQAPTGWALWDHRGFHRRTLLGLTPLLPFHESTEAPVIGKKPYVFHPISSEMMERHLAVCERIVERVRAGGRARIALVETPWVDNFEREYQTPAWRVDEEAYAKRRDAWARSHDVLWLTGAELFDAKDADFADARHIRSPEMRRRFVAMVTRELSTNSHR